MAERAGFRLLEARPVEPESSLAFAALGDLLGEELDDILPTLPAPQRRSLEVALLLSEDDGPAPDRRAVAVGVLGALRAIGAFGPVVLAIDDLHWLDAPSAGALEFALRRLRDEPIAVLAANRIPQRPALDLFRAFDVARVQRVEVKPMSLGAIGRLLRHRVDLVLPRPLLRRIHETSGGNPLFALEIARALQQGHLELTSEEPLPIPADLEALLRDRVLRLPDATRSALLICSAASRPTVELVREASGSSDDPLGPAEEAGIVAVDGGRVAFSHPLLALAVYRSASTSERRAAHRRLAEVIQDLEERARHLALASSGPNRDLAELLDRAAKRAHDRGAPGAAAELADLGSTLHAPCRPRVAVAARHGGGRVPLRGGRRCWRAGARPRAEVGRAAGPRACPDLLPPLQLLVERRQRDARAPRVGDRRDVGGSRVGERPCRPGLYRDPRWTRSVRLGARATRDRARRTGGCPCAADGRPPLHGGSGVHARSRRRGAALACGLDRGTDRGPAPVLVPACERGERARRAADVVGRPRRRSSDPRAHLP